ncbi:MAG: tRNA threonylcarbamoyladenosine dehydratase [Verrucomicrobiales bacterium]|nr:tRNA threonylcarbamoyladenosine dehydratase [Verrucomicrobiales bacterium]
MAESVDETDYQNRFSGLGRLFGDAALPVFQSAHVAVIGIGGVGSWTAEALARTGIGEITLVDLDDVCITNVNRQLHAIDGQIGKTKVAAMAERMERIFPGCRIHVREEFFTPATAEDILSGGFDCVVDAIDNVAHKCELIAACRDRKIPVVVVGGAGGKTDPACVSTADLAFATNDRLLKQVRKKLRREFDFPPEIREVPFGARAVFSTENARYPWADGSVSETPEPGSDLALNCESGFGTAAFVTGTFGFAAAAEAVKLLIEEKSNGQGLVVE